MISVSLQNIQNYPCPVQYNSPQYSYIITTALYLCKSTLFYNSDKYLSKPTCSLGAAVA